MARGWESKSVESQIEDAAREQERGPRLTREEIEMRSKREGLELSLRLVESQLSTATAAAHRATLEHARAHLQTELAKLP